MSRRNVFLGAVLAVALVLGSGGGAIASDDQSSSPPPSEETASAQSAPDATTTDEKQPEDKKSEEKKDEKKSDEKKSEEKKDDKKSDEKKSEDKKDDKKSDEKQSEEKKSDKKDDKKSDEKKDDKKSDKKDDKKDEKKHDDKKHDKDKDKDKNKKAQLKLVKVVKNDDGGKAEAKDWSLQARLGGGSWATLTQDEWTSVAVGTYTLQEIGGPSGYDWTKLVCTDSASTSTASPVVTLEKGDKVVCTFTNDDRKKPPQPDPKKKAQLKLVKKVVNNDGGTASPGDWSLQVKLGTTWTTLAQGQYATLDAGTYELREQGGPDGYDLTSLTCVDAKKSGTKTADKKGSHGDTVTLEKGEKVVCTFTNDDRKKPPQPDPKKKSYLKLVKKVVNNDGGTASPGDWALQYSLDGQTWTTLTQDQYAEVDAGTYHLREAGPDGYDLTSLTCVDAKKSGTKTADTKGAHGDTVTLEKGEKVVCTFTNDDKKKELPKKGEITLVKSVVNDDGGDAVAGDWTLQYSSDGQTWTTVAQNQVAELTVGTYRLRETGGPAGYDWTALTCSESGTPDDSVSTQNPEIVVAKGDVWVCTFTNDDQPSQPSIAKSFEALTYVGPEPVWTVAYLLTVDNSGQPRDAEYTLFDAPAFASGVTITGQSVTDVTGGGSPIAWNGQAATPIVTDATVAADATHVYRVTFTVTLSGQTPPDVADCIGEPGTGFFNEATLEWEGTTSTSDDCEPVPSQPVFSKEVVGATQVDPDTWDLTYRLLVANPGATATDYTLTDTVGSLPTGVAFVSAQAAADPAYPLTPAPVTTAWGAISPVDLAVDRPIGAGEGHAYLVTVRVDVTLTALPDPAPADCEDVPGVGYAIPNLGTIEVDGIVIDDDACAFIDIVDLGIVKTHSTIEGGAVEPGVPFSYYLDVTNHGTVAVTTGVVTDEIPADLEVQDVIAPAGWTVTLTGNDLTVENVALAVGQTLRIEVVVVLPAEAVIQAPDLDPDNVPDTFDPDFIVNLVNEACVAVENDSDPTNDCSEVTVPVDEIIANISASCVNDVAFLNYFVATSPSLQGEPITLTWTPNLQVPAPDPASIVLNLQSGDAGQLLWPGAALAPNDVSIQWPGYRPLTAADYDPVTGALLVDPALVYNGMVLDTSYPTYPWRFGTTITISVNPTLTISASYPPATINCAVPRSADLVIDKTANVQTTAPGASFEYGLSVTNLAVDSVAEPVVVTDIIPASLRVDEIITDQTAFPRWRTCAVTGQDAEGFGGTLECTLLGPLAMGTTAPLITLGVTVHSDTTVRSIVNTGEVCWGSPTDDLPFQACNDDSVTVTLSGLPATGADLPTGLLAVAIMSLLFGILAVFASRRRTHAIALD